MANLIFAKFKGGLRDGQDLPIWDNELVEELHVSYLQDSGPVYEVYVNIGEVEGKLTYEFDRTEDPTP